MSTPPAWALAARAHAQRPVAAPRLPLWLGAECIGSVQAGFLEEKGVLPLLEKRVQLSLKERSGAPAWVLQADDASAELNQLAGALRAQGACGAWRDEQISVVDAAGRVLASVERGAVRVLGIATQAVHLVGESADGAGLWLQQRALTKPTHPGRWDTLMGGMVAHGETLATALARETWEEAGLQVDRLPGLRGGGAEDIAHPSAEGGGAGYLREHLTWYVARLPQGLEPVNQDGEVQGFACLAHAEVQRRLAEGRFTPQAALVLAAYYGF